ncbi:Alpha/Beta hydrolase protein [Blyttiomyces helicus]|uniref:Alpha/Beta hydrolase protein n=1 Tax=Blyttiomyces helicus TaxID=388810 RepID=A0A4P9W7L8_9FUNG|nr:Alpha/Beta hydrolase protein [Blyttiomyces helicus]|eukprot:RKO87038.1 Alpha/Beta hydrolase protein [Blyttiomyces helicus]
MSANPIGDPPPNERLTRLAASPAFNKQITLPDGRVVSFSDLGDPAHPAVFFIHGFDSNRMGLLNCADTVTDLKLRLITIDRPGYGRTTPADPLTPSDRSPAANILIKTATLIHTLATALSIPFFGLLGQSGGAIIALVASLPSLVGPAAAARVVHPVVLTSPFLPLTTPGANQTLTGAQSRLPSAAISRMADWALAAQWKGIAWAAWARGGSLVSSTGPPPTLRDVTFMEMLRVNTAEPRRGGPGSDAIAFLAPPVFDWATDPTFPVWIFHGTEDDMVPIDAAKWVAERMPACEMVIIEGGGHFLLGDLDVAEDVFRILRGAFSG